MSSVGSVLYITILVRLGLCVLEDGIIVEYCMSKNLSIGTVITCLPKNERVQLAKKLMSEMLRFFIVNIEKVLENDEVLLNTNGHTAVILDGNCENISVLIYTRGQKRQFFELYHWLILVDYDIEKIVPVMQNADLNINSDVHIGVKIENVNNWTIFDIYNPAFNHGGQLIVKQLGYYSQSNGYQAKIQGNKYWERKNMTGVQFKSAIVIPNLDTTLDKYLANDDNRQVNSMHRFQYVTVRHCKDLYNFTMHMQVTNSWGYIQADGYFDGLVSLLEKRLIDFGSSPLLFKNDRLPVVDYSFGNWILRSTFIYRRPKVIAKSYEIFLRPLATETWVAVVVAMTIILLILRLAFGNEEHYILDGAVHDSVEHAWSFLFLFTLGAFCQQGGICSPRMVSSRILSVFVFFFCILVYQFYSASIVSYLLMDPPRTISNLRDLLQSPLRVGVEDILIDRNYFVQTTDPDATNLYNAKIKGDTNDSGFYQPSDGLEMVRRGGFALHVETSTAYPIIEETFSNELICELEEVQMYRTQPMHTNLQKHSPFREMMNFCMLKLVENGNMDRLRKHWDARKPMCIEAAKKTEVHVGISEFSCGPLVLAFGIIISLTFLAWECAYKFYSEKYAIQNGRPATVIIPFTN